MSSAPRLNRHGIPIHTPPPRCCWPKCQEASATWLNLPICQTHADLAADAVGADRQWVASVIEKRRERDEEAAKPKPVPKAPRDEVVYYLQVGGHIKIGYTGQIEQRMRTYPPNTTLLAVHPGTQADERQLHKRFAVHRSHGQEWYPLVPVILDHIKRVIAEHGEPPTITFGAKPVEVPRPHQQKNRLEAKYGPMTV